MNDSILYPRPLWFSATVASIPAAITARSALYVTNSPRSLFRLLIINLLSVQFQSFFFLFHHAISTIKGFNINQSSGVDMA